MSYYYAVNLLMFPFKEKKTENKIKKLRTIYYGCRSVHIHQFPSVGAEVIVQSCDKSDFGAQLDEMEGYIKNGLFSVEKDVSQ